MVEALKNLGFDANAMKRGLIALGGFGAIFLAKSDIDRRRRRDELKRKTELLERRVLEKELELIRKQDALTLKTLDQLEQTAAEELAMPEYR
jgi:hypothetical protein